MTLSRQARLRNLDAQESSLLVTTDADQGWEDAAAAWAEYVRSDADVLYAENVSQFLSLLPAPYGLTVDVGCGEGRLDRTLRQRGYSVVATDASPTLIQLASEADPQGDYRVAPASALPVPDRAAQLVVAFMALHDIADLEATCHEARRVLAPGGAFCFSIIHPVSSAGGFDADERFVLDSYFPARPITRPMFEMQVVQYHRPLSDYAAALSAAGFLIARIAEVPSQRRAIGRLPMFLHIAALANTSRRVGP
jgi:SAM-dependent methyltransferase